MNVSHLGVHGRPSRILPRRQCLLFCPAPIAGSPQAALRRAMDDCWPQRSSPLSCYAGPNVARQGDGGPWGHPFPHGGGRGPRSPISRLVTEERPPGVPRQTKLGSEQQAPRKGAPSFYPNQSRRNVGFEGTHRDDPRSQKGPFESLRPQTCPSMRPFVAAFPSYTRSPTGSVNHPGGSQDPSGRAGPHVRPARFENLQGATPAGTTTAEQRFLPGTAGSWSFSVTDRKQGRGPFGVSSVNRGAQTLEVGQQVDAICIRVWSRYALFRLVPRYMGPSPDYARTVPGQRPSAGIGFLHASSLKKGGRFLPPSEHGGIDLTQVRPPACCSWL